MASAKQGTLLWIDLEMTGLDPEYQRIIEVAAIITDWDFNVLDKYQAVIRQSEEVLSGMDEWCKVQHAKTGLIDAIAKGKPEAVAEEEVVEIVQAHCQIPVLLAGNSVHYDRRFIRRYWPNLESLLHYRMLDVSAWKVVMAGKLGIKFSKRESHRALEDIEGSIEELQYYLRLAKFKSKK